MEKEVNLHPIGISLDGTSKKTRRAKQLVDKCSECSSQNLIHDYDTGETICGDCGLVLYEQMMDKGPEWRAFTEEERVSRTRVGAPTSYTVYDKGLSTTISQINYDAFGRKLPLTTRIQMWRLRKWQIRSRAHSSVDKNLAQAMIELDRLCDKVFISSKSPLREIAAIIYRKALDKGLIQGRSIKTVVVAALYVACRSTGTQRKLNEIAQASLVDKLDVTRCYRFLLRELKIEIPPPDPLVWVSKIAENTGISHETLDIAIDILRNAKKRRLNSGKDPVGIAGAALWIACQMSGERKTQKDIADAAGVTTVTIRNRYQTLENGLNLKIPGY